MNPYSDKMQKLSNWELLEIVYRKDDYNEDAVSAAEIEFNSRELSTEEIEQARAAVLTRERKRTVAKEHTLRLESTIAGISDEATATIHPLGRKSTIRIIRLMGLYFFLLAVLNIYKNWWLINGLGHVDSSVFVAYETLVVSAFLLFIAALFIATMKAGWILAVVYLVFIVVRFISALTIAVNTAFDAAVDNGSSISGRDLISHELLFFGLVSLGLMAYLNTGKIRLQFNVSANLQIGTIIAGIILALLYASVAVHIN